MQRLLTTVGLGFVLYALASIAWAPAINWLAVVNLLVSAMAFYFGLRTDNPQWVWSLFLWLLLTAVPAYFLAPILNPNTFGTILAMGVAIAITYHFWLFIPVGIAGVVYTGSRGSIAACGAVCFVAALRRHPTIGLTVLAIAILAVICRQPTLDSLYARFGIWQDTFDHLSLLGSGLGSFADSYASWPVHRNMSGALAAHAYNDYLELLFNFGIGSGFGILFLCLCLSCDGPKLLVLAFLICGLTYFPFSIPIVVQVFAFSLGQLARNYYAISMAHNTRWA